MTLEEQLAAVLRRHGLKALTIVAHTRADGSAWFNAYASAAEGCGTGDCIGGNTLTVEAATRSAIDDLAAIRARSVNVTIDAALPEGLAA